MLYPAMVPINSTTCWSGNSARTLFSVASHTATSALFVPARSVNRLEEALAVLRASQAASRVIEMEREIAAVQERLSAADKRLSRLSDAQVRYKLRGDVRRMLSLLVGANLNLVL